jgi:hypothetical protein
MSHAQQEDHGPLTHQRELRRKDAQEMVLKAHVLGLLASIATSIKRMWGIRTSGRQSSITCGY